MGSPSAWIGGTICLIIWIGYGWKMRNSSDQLMGRLMGMPRSRRVFLGSGGLILGLILLLGGMVLLAMAGGADEQGIKLWAWPLILVLGLAFVHLQVLGAASMMTLALGRKEPLPEMNDSALGEGHNAAKETAPPSSASEPTEPPK